MKTSWNLGLLYKSADDPQLEKEMKESEKAFNSFAKKYKGKSDWLSSPEKLSRALDEFEALHSKRAFAKPFAYFHYANCLDSGDAKIRAKLAQVKERLMKLEQKIKFFELSIGKIPAAKQKSFLGNSRLLKYRYLLTRIFKESRHNLSESEEKILSLKRIPGHDLWTSLTEKLLGVRTVEFMGKEIPLPEAAGKIGDLPTKERRELHAKVIDVLESVGPIAESEINAVVIDKKIDDELRGFKEPYDETILRYQNDRKSVFALVDAVTKNFSLSRRFFKAKAKLLNLPHLVYADRNAGIGKDVRKITFEEAANLFKNVFGKVDKKYVDIFETFLKNGQIDVMPKKGKRGGAFCSSVTNVPTFVFLNFTDTIDSASVLAHEMGHAIHSEFSRSQPTIYQDYSTSSAEVASTLFEAFVFDELMGQVSEEEKIAMLHSKINDDINVIFRQIACFNFEIELHASIRAKGSLSKEELAALMNKHLSSYLGDAVKLDAKDGYTFVSWPHIRYFFYVYSYAFGQLISRALYEEYKKDKKFIEKINSFLLLGGSDSPENIFKSIGIDVTKPDFWIKGIRSIEGDIKKLEKMAENR